MYIGCTIDQSNRSGPFSLVVMMPDMELSDLGLRLGRGTRLAVFIYRSIADSPTTTYVIYSQRFYPTFFLSQHIIMAIM